MDKIKITLVDDHLVISEALKDLLAKVDDFQIIGMYTNGQDLLTSLKKIEHPDVILLDLNMPVMDGFETIKRLNTDFKGVFKVLVLSGYEEPFVIQKILKSGAHGYINKKASSLELELAIKTVVVHNFYLSSVLSKLLLEDKIYPKPEGLRITNIEEEILTLLCLQKDTQSIAKDLKLSKNTVNRYRANLLEKTGASNVAGLVVYAIKNGLYRIC